MTDTVRCWIAGILITGGLLFAAVSILGVFRFRFVMNRMHCAAILDTLSMAGIFGGLMVAKASLAFTPKLLAALVVLWVGSPIASHLVSRMEIATDETAAEHIKLDVIELMLLFLLLVCGVATCLSRNLLVSLVIFMAYSVMMSIVWVLLQAPDLAITEAAVGAGVSSVLLFLTLKKIRDIRKKVQDEEK